MATATYGTIIRDGLWTNNPALVAILGLCPLLAVTSNAVNGLGLGVATLITLITTNTIVSSVRHLVRPEVRIPVYILIIASVVTAIELATKAFFHDLYLVLGIFLPLIVVNCNIIGRAEAFASRNSVPRALADGFFVGLGFLLVLVVLGGMRELVGSGTLFARADILLGEQFGWLSLTLIEDFHGALIAILPPGAFIGLGLLIALKNFIDRRLQARTARVLAVPAAQPS